MRGQRRGGLEHRAGRASRLDHRAMAERRDPGHPAGAGQPGRDVRPGPGGPVLRVPELHDGSGVLHQRAAQQAVERPGACRACPPRRPDLGGNRPTDPPHPQPLLRTPDRLQPAGAPGRAARRAVLPVDRAPDRDPGVRPRHHQVEHRGRQWERQPRGRLGRVGVGLGRSVVPARHALVHAVVVRAGEPGAQRDSGPPTWSWPRSPPCRSDTSRISRRRRMQARELRLHPRRVVGSGLDLDLDELAATPRSPHEAD